MRTTTIHTKRSYGLVSKAREGDGRANGWATGWANAWPVGGHDFQGILVDSEAFIIVLFGSSSSRVGHAICHPNGPGTDRSIMFNDLSLIFIIFPQAF